jgi:lysozyme
MTDDTPLLADVIPALKADEGFRAEAYRDSLGFLTIGYGRQDAGVTEGMTCTEPQAAQWLMDKVTQTIADLDKNLSWWRKLNTPRQAVLVNMAYQLGVGGLMKFVHTLAAIQAGEFSAARGGMLSSLWAKQTPLRAKRLALQMLLGTVQT